MQLECYPKTGCSNNKASWAFNFFYVAFWWWFILVDLFIYYFVCAFFGFGFNISIFFFSNSFFSFCQLKLLLHLYSIHVWTCAWFFFLLFFLFIIIAVVVVVVVAAGGSWKCVFRSECLRIGETQSNSVTFTQHCCVIIFTTVLFGLIVGSQPKEIGYFFLYFYLFDCSWLYGCTFI